ncbi:velvet factor-domain-containing protein [Absidia repens]|uniref:Velvet factor-domain-containing protein n=1 Tax=Absidia repens TaxID=90262 RepID=A0A1X2I776_9FUNG|nr:velvet factor-domain-containing protein [Absidia repens]
MDNNVPHSTSLNEYGHYATDLPPQTHSNYHPSGLMTSPYPTTSQQQHPVSNDDVASTATSTMNTGNIDQPSTMKTAPSTISRIGYDEREMKMYELVVCQQPLHARMCGFGEKDRRPIDPPPIVQLIVSQQNQEPVDVQTLQIPFFVLHVTLWSADRNEERNIISNPPKCTRVLMGSLVSSPSLLKNPDGEQGLYFAFPDLSIRTEGRYTLRFSLMKLVSADFQTDAKSKIIAQVFSDPFTVYSAKRFPGMTESTDLSKAFAKQGLKIPIRNDVRGRKSDS